MQVGVAYTNVNFVGIRPENYGSASSTYSTNMEWGKRYAIGYVSVSGTVEKPKGHLWCEKGWENNCYHSKCVEVRPYEQSISKYWADRGNTFTASERYIKVRERYSDSEYKFWVAGNCFWRSVDSQVRSSGARSLEIHCWEVKDVDATGKLFYVEHTQSNNGSEFVLKDRRKYSFGDYYAPYVEGYDPADFSLQTHFGEETISTTPPETEVEPYVGHGRPPLSYASGSQSFMSHVGLGNMINRTYYQAISNVGKMNDNNFQNAAEIIGCVGKIITSLRSGKLVLDLPQDWQSWWLWYRYAYNTTKMDAEEGLNFLKKKCQALPNAYRRYYGRLSEEYAGDLVTCNCRLIMRESPACGPLEQLMKGLWQYGFSPNLYVLWDSLPFSFMVDWFLPMGDVLGTLSNAQNYEKWADIQSVMFSIKYRHEYPDSVWEYYTRWRSKPLAVDESYWFNSGGTSTKTTVKRVLDVVSIVTSK